jgi:hypothetical protein
MFPLAFVATAGLLAGAACGGSASASGPSGIGNQFDGVEYSAVVTEIPHETTRWFSVVVTLRNTNDVTATRSYPAGCPVRVRLYRLLDNQLVYDETKNVCGVTTATTITLLPGQAATLQSGSRWPPSVVGDSLSATTYNVRAVVQTEGTVLNEVDAGAYRIPDCQQQGGQTICT